ncbi:MAG: hypothetical protein FJY29_09070 [Betaproteobacteria bacterium]|nr:hypothetical protein [Betaproteobacteria bacterium]
MSVSACSSKRLCALIILAAACTSTPPDDAASDRAEAKAKPSQREIRIAPPLGSGEIVKRQQREQIEQVLAGESGTDSVSEVKLPASVMGLKPADITEDPISLSREQARTQRTDAEIAVNAGQGEFEKKLGDFDRVLDVSEENNRPMTPSFIGQTQKIRELFQSRKFEDALVEANELLLHYPRSALLWTMKGTLHLRLNQKDLALAAYEKSFDIEPSRRLLAQIEDLRRLVSERESMRKSRGSSTSIESVPQATGEQRK